MLAGHPNPHPKGEKIPPAKGVRNERQVPWCRAYTTWRNHFGTPRHGLRAAVVTRRQQLWPDRQSASAASGSLVTTCHIAA